MYDFNLKNFFFKIIQGALKSFEDELDNLKDIGLDGLTKPASFLFELLNRCNINFNNRQTFLDILGRLLQYFGALSPNPRHHNGASLGKFNDFLQVRNQKFPIYFFAYVIK